MDLSALQPLSDYLVVDPIEDPPDVTGVINPYGRAANEPQRGKVIAAGPGYVSHTGQLVPNPCKAGDVVLLQLNAGTEVKIGKQLVRMVQARDLFGIVREPA